MGKLFGTDGIRDLAGKGALAPDRVRKLGRVLARLGSPVLIGRDTRGSGPGIERALAQGLSEAGAEVVLAGVLPTPGVAHALRQGRYGFGVVVSASHNPAEYNGIKLFDAQGLKLPPGREAFIESRLGRVDGSRRSPGSRVISDPAPAAGYEAFLCAQLAPQSLRGWRVAVDTAQGAASGILQYCLAVWGAEVFSLGDRPDGRNINRTCGATAPAALARLVYRSRSRLGVALDGDADRCVFVDERGRIVDGDAVLYILAKDLKARRAWTKRTLVATEISNLGLDRAVRALGGRMVRTPVGDRHVSLAMRKGGYVLGGEASGHVILDPKGAGDGMLTAARMLAVMKRTGKSLSQLARGYTPFPSISHNIRVSRKPPFAKVPALARALREGTRTLGKDARLLVRYSGTEPLLRILAEGPDRKALESVVSSVATAAERLR